MTVLTLLTAGAMAEEVVVQSFDRAGKVIFNGVSNAVGYRVEWASAMAGPWTNFATAAASLDALSHNGSGMVTCVVPMLFRVVATVTNPPTPGDVILIPAGSFVMGNATNVLPADEGNVDELPQHTVSISAFYMGTCEVTQSQWDEVYAWAVTHGYDFDHVGAGKGTNHPVHTVDWYDVVKWCNARSEKEGLTACYYMTEACTTTYRAGWTNLDNKCVNWIATGYRLPTEAEWEYAARGGVANHRFPWSDSDEIQHARANYCSGLISYDTSPTRGYHPDYLTGERPYTSPAGSFAANGYGLRDVAGNVWEWCWDSYDGNYYSGSVSNNPSGPPSGSVRVIRGGSWYHSAVGCRVAVRVGRLPDSAYNLIGFRVVLSAGQPGALSQ